MIRRTVVPILALSASMALATPKDTLVYQIPSAISTIEPAQAVASLDPQMVQQLYEGLVLNNFGTYQPLLATAYTQSADGKTWTFTLRRGVTFHDGSPMTCADAEYSVRRTLLVGNETSQAAQVRANVLGIGGFTPEVKKTFTFKELASTVKCNAAGQLVIALNRAVPTLLDSLSQTYIVSMKAMAAGGDWSGTAQDFAAWMGRDISTSVLATKPNGTGAYTFVARDPSRLVLRANARYWGGVPALKTVIVQKVDSDTARVLALQKGDADIATLPDRDTLAKLRGVPGVTVYDTLAQQQQAQLSTIMMFNLNVKDGQRLPAGQLAENNIPVNFFTDVHVRRAFAAAFDVGTFVRDALHGKGLAQNTTLPASSWANDATLKPPAYDLKAAEAEFRQAWGGKLWQTGFTMPVVFAAGQGQDEIVAGIVKQNIERLNPKFHIVPTSMELSAANAALLTGKLTTTALTWGGADPDTVLRGLYGTDGILASAVNIRDARLQGLLDQAAGAVGQSARRPLYRTLLRYLNEQVYAFPLQVPVGFGATATGLRGFEAFNKTNLIRLMSK